MQADCNPTWQSEDHLGYLLDRYSVASSGSQTRLARPSRANRLRSAGSIITSIMTITIAITITITICNLLSFMFLSRQDGAGAQAD